jgi:exodeoxyribonuclease III
LNETKIDLEVLKKEKHDKLFSESYSSFWNCCKIKSGYSGVAIFTKYKPLDVIYGIDSNDHDQEGRVLTLEFPNFYIVSVYVPNAGEGLKRLNYRVEEWDSAFFAFLDKLQSKKNVILCGDLNVAHKEIDIFSAKGHAKSPGFTIEERNSFSKFLDSGYVDTFRHLYPNQVKFSYLSARGKTQKADNKGWRLDYFVIHQNSMHKLVDSDILLDYDGSDHYPIKLVWNY